MKSIINYPGESRRDVMLGKFKAAAQQVSNVNDYQFWRHDNHPIELWSNKVISQKINYVHQNTVKAGLALKPDDYKYSSAVDYVGGKCLLKDVVVFQDLKFKS